MLFGINSTHKLHNGTRRSQVLLQALLMLYPFPNSTVKLAHYYLCNMCAFATLDLPSSSLFVPGCDCTVLLTYIATASWSAIVEALSGKIVTKRTKAPNFAWGFVSM